MYDGEPQLGTDGGFHPLDAGTRIWPRQGMWLHHLLRDTKPENTLEIGLAFGFSTVYFLAAIQKNGTGRHLALDPFQDHWKGIGRTREKLLNLPEGIFSFSNEDSIQGLVRLIQEQRRFGVIFIDGDHKFDCVLIDFSLAAMICDAGAYIILDDLWMPSIRRVASFIRRNRADFTEVPTPIKNIAVFRKVAEDTRAWTHFAPF
jgi:predicted O-methyltransferase YrrM